MKKFILMLALAAAGATTSRAQLSQDFESTTGTALPTGWSQGTATSPGWQTGVNTAFNVGNWPNYVTSVAHTRYACVVDASSTNLNTADTLMSPSFSLVGTTNPFLKFDVQLPGYYYNGGAAEYGLVLASNNNGPWTIIDSAVKNGGSWFTQHTSLMAYAGATNLRLAFKYSDGGGYLFGMGIDNISTYTNIATDLSLVQMLPKSNDPVSAYGHTSGTLPLTALVQNLGATPVTSFSVTYQINANAPVTVPVTGVSINPYKYYTFNGSIAVPATMGAYSLKVWVTQTGDLNHANDTLTAGIGAYATAPTKRMLFEEATGTWCGWCVRGIVYMDSLEGLYGNGVSLVAVHNADPMTVTAYDSWITAFPKFSGFPNAVIDRRELTDPSNLVTAYNSEHNTFGFADIAFGTHTISGNSVSIPFTVTPAFPLSGDYRLVMALTEDRIHAPANPASNWLQHNYYSSASQNIVLVGQGISYRDSGTTLSNVYYAHVARGIYPSVTGSANLPATMAVGTPYNVTLTGTIDPSWNRPFVKVVVMLVRGSDGVVLNTNNSTLWNVGVQNVNPTANVSHVAVYPNPASTQTNVAFELSKSSNVTINVTDMAGRQVYTSATTQYGAGTFTVTVPTSNLASGMYNVTVTTENGSITDHLSVVK